MRPLIDRPIALADEPEVGRVDLNNRDHRRAVPQCHSLKFFTPRRNNFSLRSVWREVYCVRVPMPHTAAKLLATGKGFGLCDARSPGRYYLFDSLTGLPAVNLRQGKMWFTLQEVVEFLDSLVGRPLSREA